MKYPTMLIRNHQKFNYYFSSLIEIIVMIDLLLLVSMTILGIDMQISVCALSWNPMWNIIFWLILKAKNTISDTVFFAR